jgi:hypothetical protein
VSFLDILVRVRPPGRAPTARAQGKGHLVLELGPLECGQFNKEAKMMCRDGMGL